MSILRDSDIGEPVYVVGEKDDGTFSVLAGEVVHWGQETIVIGGDEGNIPATQPVAIVHVYDKQRYFTVAVDRLFTSIDAADRFVKEVNETEL